MSRLLLAVVGLSIAAPAFAANKAAAPAPKKGALDCDAYFNHLSDLSWADFLAHEGKDLSKDELAASKGMFVGQLKANKDIQAVIGDCKQGALPKAIYDCQMKAKSLDGFDKCGQ